MEALRAEMSIAELCRKYSINESQYFTNNKEFIEVSKKRLSRETTNDEVQELKKENQRLKEMVADLVLRYDVVKKIIHAGFTVKYKKYMRFTVSEKQEIINMVVRCEIGLSRIILKRTGIQNHR